jgi:hypothetical protein
MPGVRPDAAGTYVLSTCRLDAGRRLTIDRSTIRILGGVTTTPTY